MNLSSLPLCSDDDLLCDLALVLLLLTLSAVAGEI